MTPGDDTSSSGPPVSGRERLALHACCGPCLLEPIDELLHEGFEITVVYFNPNIHPLDEYVRRRDTLMEYASEHGIEVVELPYDPAVWKEAVGSAAERPERCRACYRLRIGAVADWGAAEGVDAVATTLTVSPYQDAAAIAEEGQRAALAAGVRYVDRDFRQRYPEATRRSRELGMYRQNYCGCAPSAAEAQAEREARRAERAARKVAER